MRIIAGKHRGRTIMLPKDGKIGGKLIRPTSDFAREGIFNILTHGKFSEGENVLTGARVLDVCAGTGALGLEALSRGAQHVMFIDNNRDIAELIRSNIQRFGESGACKVMTAEATDLPPAPATYTLAFIDPPYSLGLIPAILKSLDVKNWLEKEALVIAEHDERETLTPPPHFDLLESRRYGRAIMSLFRYRHHSKT